MKKKVYLLLLASVLVFTGCQKKEVSPETKETGIETKKETESEKETEKLIESEKETESQSLANAPDELLLSDDIYSFQVGIDGTIYQFPMEYEAFLAKGWTFSDDEETTLSPNQYALFNFKKGDLRITGYVFNPAGDVKPINEGYLAGFTVDEYDAKKTEAVFELPKGITMGTATMDDIIAAYGEPTDKSESDTFTTLKYEYASYQEIRLRVGAENGVLNSIEIKNLVEPKDQPAAEKVSAEATPEVQAYAAPAELGDDLKSAIVEYDGVLYQLPAPVSEFEKNGWTIQVENSEESVDAKGNGWVTLTKNNQKLRTLTKNYGDTQTSIQNCFVTQIESSDQVKVAIMLQKSITIGMAESDFVSAIEGMEYKEEESTTYKLYEVQIGDRTTETIDVYVKDGALYKIEVDYGIKKLK
jgi:hypothetical protein